MEGRRLCRDLVEGEEGAVRRLTVGEAVEEGHLMMAKVVVGARSRVGEVAGEVRWIAAVVEEVVLRSRARRVLGARLVEVKEELWVDVRHR